MKELFRKLRQTDNKGFKFHILTVSMMLSLTILGEGKYYDYTS